MPHRPVHVANTFLQRGRDEGVEIDPLKLQKLVYFLQGWNLATQNEPVVGEQFEAWPYGPVLSSLYQEFKEFGSRPITRYGREFDPETGEKKAFVVSRGNEDFWKVFEKVWKKYKSFTGLELSAMTHALGSPWKAAREAGKSYIPDREISRYFKTIGG